jgi:hypothetical protein
MDRLSRKTATLIFGGHSLFVVCQSSALFLHGKLRKNYKRKYALLGNLCQCQVPKTKVQEQEENAT